MVGRPVAAVIGGIELEHRPAAGRVAALAHGDVDVRRPNIAASRRHIEGEHGQEPPVGLRVVQAARVGQERTVHSRGPVDRRRIAEERVQRLGAGQHVTAGIVRGEDVVDGLHDVAVAHAEPLVRRLEAELVPAARRARIVVADAVEPEDAAVGPRDRLRRRVRNPGRPDGQRGVDLRLHGALQRIGLRNLGPGIAHRAGTGRLRNDCRGRARLERDQRVPGVARRPAGRGSGRYEGGNEHGRRDNSAKCPSSARSMPRLGERDHVSPPMSQSWARRGWGSTRWLDDSRCDHARANAVSPCISDRDLGSWPLQPCPPPLTPAASPAGPGPSRPNG